MYVTGRVNHILSCEMVHANRRGRKFNEKFNYKKLKELLNL